MSKRLQGLVAFLRAKRYLKWRILAAVFIALILVSRLAVWFVLDQTNTEAAKQNFDVATVQAVNGIQNQFEIYANTLYAARALFLTGNSITRQNWETFIDAQQLDKRYPAFYAIGYISVIHQAEIAKLTTQLNANRLTSETTPIAIQPQTTGDTLAVITYIAPSTASQAVIGYNVLSDTTRARALAAARDTGLPYASKPLTLSIDPASAPPSVLIVLPIYTSSASHLYTVAQRQSALQGYVVLALRTKPLLDGIFSSPPSSTLNVSVISGGETVYQHGAQLSGTTLEKQQRVTVAGQTWTLDFKAPANFGVSAVAQMAPTILTISAIPFLLVVGIILYFATRVYRPYKADPLS